MSPYLLYGVSYGCVFKKKMRYKVFILLKVTHSLDSAKNRFGVNRLNSLYWFIQNYSRSYFLLRLSSAVLYILIRSESLMFSFCTRQQSVRPRATESSWTLCCFKCLTVFMCMRFLFYFECSHSPVLFPPPLITAMSCRCYLFACPARSNYGLGPHAREYFLQM